MGLSNYQLVLLDNLIYLDTIVQFADGEDNVTIEKVVDTLLYAPGSTTVGTGTIKSDCNDPYKVKGDNCLMNLEEWKDVLLAIKNDEALCSLTIHSVENDREDGFRAMALTGENIDENIIIFKGTTSANEWIDNGIGGYSLVTSSQQRALDFVKGIDIVNNKSFVTSGHSKGGNMAQYVALFCDEPPIDRFFLK